MTQTTDSYASVNGVRMWYDVRGEGEPPAPLVAAYAEVSPDGADHFPVILGKVARAITEEPWLTSSDLSAITCPTLVIAGDDDLVTLEHTLELYRSIADAQLAILRVRRTCCCSRSRRCARGSSPTS